MPRHVVISGASSGLGLALARHYLQQGAIVAAFARRADKLQALSAEFPQQVYTYPLDIRNSRAIDHAAEHFMLQAGIPDIVIANAGVSIGTLTTHPEDNDNFQQVIDTNVCGIMQLFQPFLSAMQQRNSGSLVGIASVAGLRGLPGAGAYSASKAAAISYLESLRVELHHSGLNVTTICPGYIRTPMTDINPYPMPFLLEPEDAARRISRAISRQASYCIIPWQMAIVGWVLKRLPDWLYDRLFANAPHKPRKPEQ